MNGHNPDGMALQRFLNRNLLTEKGSPAEFFQSFFSRFHMAAAASSCSNPTNTGPLTVGTMINELPPSCVSSLSQ